MDSQCPFSEREREKGETGRGSARTTEVGGGGGRSVNTRAVEFI